jgi:hypothetical protein
MQKETPRADRRETRFPSKFFVLFSFITITAPCYCQDNWYEQIFVEGAVHYYFVSGFFSELVKPEPGFRAALGYEYNHFRFGLESGYTHIAGTNPLVLDIKLSPLALKAGYGLPIRWGLGLQADLSFGLAFLRIIHYDSVLNMIKENSQDSRAASLLGGARLYATYTFPFRYLKLYVGGGLDMLIETDGPVPLPLIEAGISLKPFAIKIPKKEKPAVEISVEESPEPVPDAAELVFTHTPEEEQEQTSTWLLNTVYFEADTAVLIERCRPVLDEAGERLRADPSLRLTLRAYTAPFGTAVGRAAVAEARARFCAEYFMNSYGIAEERMKIENYGSEKEPEWIDESWESWRCVEIFFNK